MSASYFYSSPSESSDLVGPVFLSWRNPYSQDGSSDSSDDPDLAQDGGDGMYDHPYSRRGHSRTGSPHTSLSGGSPRDYTDSHYPRSLTASPQLGPGITGDELDDVLSPLESSKQVLANGLFNLAERGPAKDTGRRPPRLEKLPEEDKSIDDKGEGDDDSSDSPKGLPPCLDIPTNPHSAVGYLREAYHDKYPFGQIISRTFYLWFVPLILVGIWLAIPLSESPSTNSDKPSMYLYSIFFRAFYVSWALYTAFLAFEMVTPVPPKHIQVILVVFGFGGADIFVHLVILRGSGLFSLLSEVSLVLLWVSVLVIFQVWWCWRVGWFKQSTYSVTSYISRDEGDTAKSSKDGATGNPIRVFGALFVTLAIILVVYAYCQAFTYIFTRVAKDQPTLQLVLSFAFGIPITFFGNIQRVLADWVDGQSGTGKALAPTVTFIEELLHQVFYKNLFTSVSEFYVVAVLLLISMAQQVAAYPLRMTKAWHKAKTWMVRKTQGSWFRYVIIVVTGEDSIDDIEDYRNEVDVDFYYLCMAQRIALTGFVAYLPLLRYGYNSPFFTYSDRSIDDEQFRQLLWFAVIMLFVEWGGSTLLHIIILIAFKRDTIKLGTVSMIACGAVSLTIAAATHVISDVFAALIEVSFP